MIAGITAQIISVPRGDCGTGAPGPASRGGAKAERSMKSSATMQIDAATQKIGSASDCIIPIVCWCRIVSSCRSVQRG